MDDLFGLIVIVLGIISAISKNNKKKQKVAAKAQVKMAKTWPTLEKSIAEFFEEAPAAKPAATQGATTAQSKTHEGLHPCDEHSSEPAKVAQPKVQLSDKPVQVVGSMQADSHEGLHPCDEHDAQPARAVKPLLPMDEEEPGIQLEWTGDNLVKAFIMQEVLTRPCQRRRA